MNNEIAISSTKMPTIQELYKKPEMVLQQDQINFLLSSNPPQRWIKEHPYVKGHLYLPIEKVEFMLKKLFKKTRIEILREGTSFNGIYVVVRVWYQDIVSGEMDFHDGIGAMPLQVKAGKSPSDLANINAGAISMAFPIAKTLAIKDACDHFGAIFGSNLNRKELERPAVDEKLALTVEEKRVEKLIEKAKTVDELTELEPHLTEATKPLWQTKWIELTK